METTTDDTKSADAATPADTPQESTVIAKSQTDKEAIAPDAATAAAVVSLEEETPHSTKETRLEDFEDEILMNIFAFLDALEILNTAQINTRMYNRVDSLFGLGEGGGGGATDNTTIATDEGSLTGTADGMAGTTTTTTTTTTVTSSSSVTGIFNDSRKPPARSNSTGATPTPTTAPAAPVSPPRATSSLAAASASSLTSSTQQQASAVMNNVFQMFQPRRGGPSTTPTRRGGSTNAPIMNAATASSVASKLTDSELNAILSMMERMRQKEAAVERLKSENEQLKAELDGTQSVKDFLIQKVRAMEESLTRQEENETKVAQQIASDQEVIAFLDGRVQELERQLETLRADQAVLDADRDTLRANLEQKSTVLHDMLQFERERFVEFEKEAKSTKKVLVKEIKLCRNQIVALTAERDALKEQNHTLQKAVLHASSSSGGGGGNFGERVYA